MTRAAAPAAEQTVCTDCGHLHYGQVSDGACTRCDCTRRNAR